MEIASGVKERKAQFLQRSTDRLLAQEGEQEEDEHDQLQIEESTQHFAPLSSRIISLTTHAGKKRRFDSGIGLMKRKRMK
ncbi:hypothetical protein BGX38DRAFT_1276661 [Terfezia claveryi]|nr:hypothetical protein BGX38DRAFT_1276661 [Terfezia claveryi]